MMGNDHFATSKVMGHSSMMMTNTYTDIPMGRLEKATHGLTFLQELEELENEQRKAKNHADIFADILTRE